MAAALGGALYLACDPSKPNEAELLKAQTEAAATMAIDLTTVPSAGMRLEDETGHSITIASEAALTTDTDGDKVVDILDRCLTVPSSGNKDADGDRIGDVCDNCPDVKNSWQIDMDGDENGDACDPDIDGDGILNPDDPEPEDEYVPRVFVPIKQ